MNAIDQNYFPELSLTIEIYLSDAFYDKVICILYIIQLHKLFVDFEIITKYFTLFQSHIPEYIDYYDKFKVSLYFSFDPHSFDR